MQVLKPIDYYYTKFDNIDRVEIRHVYEMIEKNINDGEDYIIDPENLNLNCDECRNCICCIDCDNCENCRNCGFCSECKNSRNCHDCVKCENCNLCFTCDECKNCEFSYQCNKCNESAMCINHNNCTKHTPSCLRNIYCLLYIGISMVYIFILNKIDEIGAYKVLSIVLAFCLSLALCFMI